MDAPLTTLPAGRASGPRIVVIDAGHGGHDPGTVSKGIHEKEICLEVAQRMAKELNKTKGVKAVLTRDKDTFIALRERMRGAEREDADLFVSLHVNSAPSRQARGVEVFYLSLGAASDEASRELARLENEADPTYVVEEDGALRNIPFALDLRQSDTLLRSSRAAEVVLDLLADEKLALARGVKQAGFAVLKSYQVPSVLVELGFLSSAQDREKLKTPAHRQALAEALARGVARYFEKYAPQRPLASSN
jgi:N-acetylmuramoyl-L-alanine amidase